MIRKQTKFLAIVSFTFALASVTGGVFFWKAVANEKDTYHEKLAQQADIESNRASLADITKALEDTRRDREHLTQTILTDDQLIEFLTLIESLGAERGVAITISIAPEQSGNFEILTFSLKTSGSHAGTIEVLTLLENLAYNSSVDSVQLIRTQSETGEIWDGTCTLRVLKFIKV